MIKHPARNLRKLFLLVAAWQLGGMLVHGQVLHATGPLPSYEVATIRPADPNSRGMTADSYIRRAFNLPSFDGVLLGGPAWIAKNQYVFKGKPSDAESEAMKKMSLEERLNRTHLLDQSLLADRFKLKVHFETRVLPVYELVVAKGGPKMTQNEKSDGPADVMRMESKGVIKFTAQNQTIAALAARVQSYLDRPVVDKTGLAGKFDFHLQFAWNGSQPGAVSDSNDAAPSLFTAIQDLGLKLEPAKDPLEVVVMDHIELPSEN